MTRVRRGPCVACPYRRDVPPAVWHPDEYDKLRDYDRSTAYQPPESFRCHASPDSCCAGWAHVHQARGHDHDLLALRLVSASQGRPIELPVTLVKFWPSGNAAADHGQSAMTHESDEARLQLLTRHQRLAERFLAEARAEAEDDEVTGS